MSETVGQDAACAALGVDARGLERLIACEGLDAAGDRGARRFDRAALKAYAASRARRQADALNALAAIDGPHLGGDR